MEQNKIANEIIFYSTPQGDKTLDHQYQTYDFNYGGFAIIKSQVGLNRKNIEKNMI